MASDSRFWLFNTVLAAATALVVSCAPAPSGIMGAQQVVTKPTAQTSMPDRYAELREAVARSEAILTARVLDVDFSAPASDGFLSTLHVQVNQVLRGQASIGQRLCIRVPEGQERNGQWRVTAHSYLISDNPKSRVGPGQELLLFLSRPYYEVQAKARNGMVLPKCTAAPFGMARVQSGNITTGHLAYETPGRLDDLKRFVDQSR